MYFINEQLFFQSVAAAISFFYASHLGLFIQLAILLVLATIGTVAFVAVEWKTKKGLKDDDDSSNE